MKECLLVCEECMAIFKPEELTPDGKWAHKCKEKKFRRETRCESYIDTYVKESA